MFPAVLGIRDILVRIRIRIPGSVPLINGSGSGDPTPFFTDFKDAKKKISYFFHTTCLQAHYLQSKTVIFAEILC